MPGGMEWVLIFLVVLLFFGAAKLPELARGLGQAIREFRKASKEVTDDLEDKGKDSDGTRGKDDSANPPSKE
jgi:sec-independent protein translocase protein TatA